MLHVSVLRKKTLSTFYLHSQLQFFFAPRLSATSGFFFHGNSSGKKRKWKGTAILSLRKISRGCIFKATSSN